MVNIQVVGVVTFYMVAALVMVLVNKAVLNDAPDMPLLFMLFQSTTTVLLLHLTASISGRIQVPVLDLTTAKKLAPLLFVDASGFIFNALCLRDVEAAFFQIARGLVLPLTIAVSSIHTRERPAAMVMLSAAIVTAGFFVGITPTAETPLRSIPRPLGLFYGFLSSCSIAIHAVLIKSSLPHVHGSVTQLAYWSNISSAMVLAVVTILNGEVRTLAGLIKSGTWDSGVFLWGNLVTGLFGFLISIAGILSVKITSPVTHMFSSAARTVIQAFLGVQLFGDTITLNRMTSLIVIVSGTILYMWVKSQQQTSERPPEPEVELEAQSLMTKGDPEEVEREEKSAQSMA